MKPGTNPSRASGRSLTAGKQAFTLVEMMITMAIFSLGMAACLYVHLFGLRQDQLVESKLGASDQSRKSFDRITSDIRSAKVWQIGNYASSAFTANAFGTNQQGNALQISFTNNYSVNVTYFFATVAGDGQLCRIRTGDSTCSVLASNLFNTLSFVAEKEDGSIVNDLQWRYAIHFILQFRQYQYPITVVGTNGLYDFYKMEFRVTPRAPD